MFWWACCSAGLDVELATGWVSGLLGVGLAVGYARWLDDGFVDWWLAVGLGVGLSDGFAVVITVGFADGRLARLIDGLLAGLLVVGLACWSAC